MRSAQMRGDVSLEDVIRVENAMDRALREARLMARRRAKPVSNAVLSLDPEDLKSRVRALDDKI